MKNIAVFIIMFTVGIATAFGQVSTLNDLDPFDKMIVKGEVEEIKLFPAREASPVIKLDGIQEEDYTARVTAGTLTLTLKNNTPVRIEVYNKRLKRIEGPENIPVKGAEVIGGKSGNYLVVSFHDRGGAWVWAGEGVHINIPEIPDIDVDLPDLPEMNFNFEEFEHDFKFDWEDHKEQLKLWSEEWGEEVREAMEEAREEMKEAREKMKEARQHERALEQQERERARQEMERAEQERQRAMQEREQIKQDREQPQGEK